MEAAVEMAPATAASERSALVADFVHQQMDELEQDTLFAVKRQALVVVEQARDSAHSLLKKSSLEAQQRRADAYDEESRWDRSPGTQQASVQSTIKVAQDVAREAVQLLQHAAEINESLRVATNKLTEAVSLNKLVYDDVRVQQQLAVDLARQGSEQLNKLQAREAELRSAVHAHQAALSMSSTALSTLKSVKEILIEQHKMVDSLLQSTRGLDMDKSVTAWCGAMENVEKQRRADWQRRENERSENERSTSITESAIENLGTVIDNNTNALRPLIVLNVTSIGKSATTLQDVHSQQLSTLSKLHSLEKDILLGNGKVEGVLTRSAAKKNANELMAKEARALVEEIEAAIGLAGTATSESIAKLRSSIEALSSAAVPSMFVSPQKIATSMMALSSAIPSPLPADDYQTVPSESVPAAVVPLLKEIEQIMNAVLVPDVEGDDYENDYVGESQVAKEESQLIQTNERLKREIASTRALANHQLESYYASLIKREMLLSNDIKTKTGAVVPLSGLAERDHLLETSIASQLAAPIATTKPAAAVVANPPPSPVALPVDVTASQAVQPLAGEMNAVMDTCTLFAQIADQLMTQLPPSPTSSMPPAQPAGKSSSAKAQQAGKSTKSSGRVSKRSR